MSQYAPTSDPADLFKGTVVVAAPHMDDEVLACGSTIAQLPDKNNVHVIFATDGSQSPVPQFSWMGKRANNLPEIRKAEAISALNVLGVPEDNLYFLGFPDSELKNHIPELIRVLTDWLEQLRPSYLFLPFRFDRHPDHLALYESGLSALAGLDLPTRVVEYFVYYRWQLVPGKDIRMFIREENRVVIGVQRDSDQKLRALEQYTSQTTKYFDWQDRPILPRQRLVEVSQDPEMFIFHDPSMPGASVFTHFRPWLQLVHMIEPPLKKSKDWLKQLVQRKTLWNGRRS